MPTKTRMKNYWHYMGPLLTTLKNIKLEEKLTNQILDPENNSNYSDYVTGLAIEWQDMEFRVKTDEKKEDAKWRLILAVWKEKGK